MRMPLNAFARLIPFLVAVIGAFVIYQLYTAVMFVAQSMYAFALFNAVFGFAGIALARALWINRKSVRPPAA
jgi:hypothetical protein